MTACYYVFWGPFQVETQGNCLVCLLHSDGSDNCDFTFVLFLFFVNKGNICKLYHTNPQLKDRMFIKLFYTHRDRLLSTLPSFKVIV